MRQEKQNNLCQKWQNGNNKHETTDFVGKKRKYLHKRKNKHRKKEEYLKKEKEEKEEKT